MTHPESTTHSHFNVFSQSYVFDPRPHLPFRISVKRYWTDTDTEGNVNANTGLDAGNLKTRGDPLTVVFAHAVGYHKEHWEPIIHRLFEQQRAPGRRSFRVQDMWALDAPNHGDSAVMNEEVLTRAYNGRMFSTQDYARCVHAFLAGLGTGVDVDFSKRNVVAVGHSLGAAALLLSTQYAPRITFASLHLFEPIVLGRYSGDFGALFADAAIKRRDTWDSAAQAYKAMKSRRTWQIWDDRVLRLYVEHGLRPVSTRGGVTFKCTTAQEAACFRDHWSFKAAYDHLPRIVQQIPTHIAYGEVADFVPLEWQHDVLYKGAGDIAGFASATVVPGAGHLMVQTHPEAVADALARALFSTHVGRRAVTAKL